jgi:hypothetical protein
MAGDPAQYALDGRSNGGQTLTNNVTNESVTIVDNQALPWRPVEHYRKVHDSQDRTVARSRGSLGARGFGGPPAGQPWDTPSMEDASTAGSEIWNVVYVDPTGEEWTGMDILIELFKAQRGFTGGAKVGPAAKEKK